MRLRALRALRSCTYISVAKSDLLALAAKVPPLMAALEVSLAACLSSRHAVGTQVEYKEALDLKSVLHLPEGRKLFAEFTVKEHSEENLKVIGRACVCATLTLWPAVLAARRGSVERHVQSSAPGT